MPDRTPNPSPVDDPNRKLHHHLQISSSDAPSYGMAEGRALDTVEWAKGPKADAVHVLYAAVCKLTKLPVETLVNDRRVHAILDDADVNRALGVLIAVTVHPKSHFPGPLVCFRDKIVAIRRAADALEQQEESSR